MNDRSQTTAGPQKGRRIALAVLISLSAFMYVSIMLKIIKFGP